MKVDFFYKGRTYGSAEAKEAPRVGALYGDKMITQVTDMRFTNLLSEGEEAGQPDFICELGDP